MALGQEKVDDKSNEIKTIPELIQVLDLAWCLVTIDVISCQRETAQTIVDHEANYILEVKENQGHLYEDIADTFAGAGKILY